MKVLKFGGGCLKDIHSIKKLPSILKKYDNKIIIVISAFGKLTNLLERIYSSKGRDVKEVISFFKDIMLQLNFSNELIRIIINYVLDLSSSNTSSKASFLSIGELISAKILSFYFHQINFAHNLLNAYTIIQTDNNGVNSSVNWDLTVDKFTIYKDKVLTERSLPILTQGFIAGSGTNENFAITCLGREGSDYSAAIFGNIFNADEVLLFKDVNGIYSEDPKKNPSSVFFSELSYETAFKICNHQNTVVHPKTIKKLQEKGIPLIIRKFNDLNCPGTRIR